MTGQQIRAFVSWWLPVLFSLVGGAAGILLAAGFLARPRIGDLRWWQGLERIMSQDAPARMLAQIPTWAIFGAIAGLIAGSILFIGIARSWIAYTRLQPTADTDPVV